MILKSVMLAFASCLAIATVESIPELYKYNVLLILVDDLRPLAQEQVNLIHINNLARNGVIFKNAFVQQALCGPSRTSLLTGRRPDSLRLYDFYSYWRASVGNYTTLPQHFKDIGYTTYSVGKVFHPGASSNFTDDYPYSWSNVPFHPPSEKYKDSSVCREKNNTNFHKNLICPVRVNEQPGETLPDIETLKHAVEIIKITKQERKPFFLAVGFHKPHIPFKYPKKYLRQVDKRGVVPAKNTNRPKKLPMVAWHPWTDVRKREDIHKINIPFPFGKMPKKWAKKIKRNYFAAALYIDDMVGQLLKHVDMDNTVIVFTSDHGWSLGENGLWAKYSNFDVALKVPLVIKVPGYQHKTIYEPVELIDLFPTLTDILQPENGIPKCQDHNYVTDLCFEGKSLVPLLQGVKNISEDYYAISQYPRPSVYPQRNSDKPRLADVKIMGYSIRTKTLRYTEWISFNSTDFTRDWNKIYGVELYDHKIDPMESNNLYLNPKYADIKHTMSNLLRSKIN